MKINKVFTYNYTKIILTCKSAQVSSIFFKFIISLSIKICLSSDVRVAVVIKHVRHVFSNKSGILKLIFTIYLIFNQIKQDNFLFTFFC